MRFILTAFFMLCLIDGGRASAEQIQGSRFGFGNWSGAAYTSDATGEFSHCAVSAVYKSGDTLVFSVNSNATVSVAVANPNLGLVDGQQFPVALYIDRREPFYGTATAVGSEMAVLQIREFERAMTSIRKGYVLRIESPLGTGVYNLKDTFRALETTTNCALHYLDYAALPAKPNREQPFDRTVLFQIATEMIAEVGITDFRYFNEADTRKHFAPNAVLWASEASGVFGGVTIIPLGDMKSLRDADGGDINFLTKDCQGEVATTARNISAKDLEARELRALCVTSGGSEESLLTKIMIGEHVLYTFLVFDENATDYAEESRPAISKNVAIRAASYVREAVDLE